MSCSRNRLSRTYLAVGFAFGVVWYVLLRRDAGMLVDSELATCFLLCLASTVAALSVSSWIPNAGVVRCCLLGVLLSVQTTATFGILAFFYVLFFEHFHGFLHIEPWIYARLLDFLWYYGIGTAFSLELIHLTAPAGIAFAFLLRYFRHPTDPRFDRRSMISSAVSSPELKDLDRQRS